MKEEYGSLEQRLAATYLETFPPFVPDPEGPREDCQAALYSLIKDVYQRIQQDPAILFTALHTDDAFPNRYNNASYNKAKLAGQMKAILKKIDGILQMLLELGARIEDNIIPLEASFRITNAKARLLSVIGLPPSIRGNSRCIHLPEDGKLATAWFWMATRDGIDIRSFGRCLFDRAYPYNRDTFSELLGEKSVYLDLMNWLEANGYQRTLLRCGRVTLDYAKEYGKPSPLKDAWAERTHAGVGFDYQPTALEPAAISLRLPYAKDILLKADRMEDSLRGFVTRCMKKCDACGYCTQTDKTGRRKPVFIQVPHDGKAYALCPLFPGFALTWNEIDHALKDNIIRFLQFIDASLTQGCESGDAKPQRLSGLRRSL